MSKIVDFCKSDMVFQIFLQKPQIKIFMQKVAIATKKTVAFLISFGTIYPCIILMRIYAWRI